MHCAAINHLLYLSSWSSSMVSSSAINALSTSTPSSSKSISLESEAPPTPAEYFSTEFSGTYGVTTTGKVIVRAVTAGAANKATIFPTKVLPQKWWRVGKSACHIRHRTCFTLWGFDGGVNCCDDASVSEGRLDGKIIWSSLTTLAVGDLWGEHSCNWTLPVTASHGS